MKPHSLWEDQVDAAAYPSLGRNLRVDALVIGGGITGVTAACLLAEAGKKVALVERFHLGAGDTGHTTAHLTYMTDTRLSHLIHVCGEEHAQAAWQAGQQAMDQICDLAARHHIGAGLIEVPGYLVAAEGDAEVDTLRGEAEMARKLGFDIEYLQLAPPTNRPGIRFHNQLKFHPLRYLQGLAAQASKLGAMIFEHTCVTAFDGTSVTANGHEIVFDHVVIATHVPLQGKRGMLSATLFQTKLASYSTYAVAAAIPKDSLEEMIWSDTGDPFNYLRVERSPGCDVAILGGEDHKTGQVTDTAACFERLENRLTKIIPDCNITHRWSGQVVDTVDGLPYIGAVGNAQFIATGYSGNGMTFGTIAAVMARDWITGKPNRFERTFDPGRVELASAGTYLSENSDFPYHLIKDRMARADGMPRDLSPGQGQVVRVGGQRVAHCLEPDGSEHWNSAVCPHMGCLVAWNDAESTWDCPCHGSRFAAGGTVIAGPAQSDLEPLQKAAAQHPKTLQR